MVIIDRNMENSFFVLSEETQLVEIERFHVCTWEFNNDSALVELGFEVSKTSLTQNNLSIYVYIPWLSNQCKILDLYNKLSNAENSRFIFNDSINGTDYLVNDSNKSGVIHKFSDRDELCVLPLKTEIENNNILKVNVNLDLYNSKYSSAGPNIYFRFSIEPNCPYISIRKNGISKSSILYDFKINEKRNLPVAYEDLLKGKILTRIKTCFLFNIIPNKFDIIFIDNSSLKNVRNLEYKTFNNYLGDHRIKDDELIVIFQKKNGNEAFSFFSIYAKERIGFAQFSFALMLNIFCSFIFYIAPLRTNDLSGQSYFTTLLNLPIEIYIALALMVGTVIYFLIPIFPKKKSGSRKKG